MAMPMNLGRHRHVQATDEVRADIARIETIWREARHATRFLYSDAFGAADAMYAPVVARFLSYLPALSPDSHAYCQAVREHPLMAEWYEAASREPVAWHLARYEDLP
jgi:glutathione S-transferase